MSSLSFFRAGLQSLFLRAGYEVRPRGAPLHSFDEGLRLLSLYIQPRSVIDVGVGSGTPALYSRFPSSANKYLLVEPDPYHFPLLDSLSSALSAATERVACGSSRGTSLLHAFSDHCKSSLRSPFRSLHLSEDIVVPVETLDYLMSKHHLPGPYLVKIDVEGSEDAVIEGGVRTLSDACGAIIEVSFVPRFSCDPSFSDIACRMKGMGFEVFDIVAGTVDARGLLSQADVIFIRHNLAPR